MGETGAMAAVMGMQAVSSIAGGIENAQSIKAQGEYQQTVANTNAKMAELQGNEALVMGSYAASRRNIQARQQVGQARTAMAGSGVDLSSGTAKSVISATQNVGMQDEIMIRNNAARQAWGYKMQAMQDTFQGKYASLTANAQARQSILTGGIKAIEEPLSTYSNYKMWQMRRGGGQSDNSINLWGADANS